MASTLKAETAWVNPHEPATYEFGRTYDIDQAWVTSLFNFQMVLPCFSGTLIFLDKEITKKHGIARHEAGLGRSEYQESGWKGSDVGGLWLEGGFFSPCKIGRWRSCYSYGKPPFFWYTVAESMESDESQLLLDLKADQHGHGCSQLSMGRHITDQKKGLNL